MFNKLWLKVDLDEKEKKKLINYLDKLHNDKKIKAIIEEIPLANYEYLVRLLGKVKDQEYLSNIAIKYDEFELISLSAIEHIEDDRYLTKTARDALNNGYEAFKKISDRSYFEDLLFNARSAKVRLSALVALDDQRLYEKVLLKASDPVLVEASLERIRDKEVIKKAIAKEGLPENYRRIYREYLKSI
jgi:hypothetical protein